METENKIVALTASEIDSLKQGYVVTTSNGVSVKLVNGIPSILKKVQGKVPFKRAFVPSPQNADCVTLTAKEMLDLFDSNLKGSIYRSSGAKNDKGEVMLLQEQIQKGVAREIYIELECIDNDITNRDFENYRVKHFEEKSNTATFEVKSPCNVILAEPTNFIKF